MDDNPVTLEHAIITITIISREGIPGKLAPFVFAYEDCRGDPNKTRARYDSDTRKIRWCGGGMFDPEPATPPENHKQIESVLRGYVESLGYKVDGESQ